MRPASTRGGWTFPERTHSLPASASESLQGSSMPAAPAASAPNGKLSANTLWGRFGGMHLEGSRNFSTFRLTLTAALRHSGEPVTDEPSLTRWMHEHMRV